MSLFSTLRAAVEVSGSWVLRTRGAGIEVFDGTMQPLQGVSFHDADWRSQGFARNDATHLFSYSKRRLARVLTDSLPALSFVSVPLDGLAAALADGDIDDVVLDGARAAFVVDGSVYTGAFDATLGLPVAVLGTADAGRMIFAGSDLVVVRRSEALFIDVSDPHAPGGPRAIALPPPGGSSSVAVALVGDGRVWAGNSGGLALIDPANDTVVASWSELSGQALKPAELFPLGDVLLVGQGNSLLKLDVSTPTSPAYLATATAYVPGPLLDLQGAPLSQTLSVVTPGDGSTAPSTSSIAPISGFALDPIKAVGVLDDNLYFGARGRMVGVPLTEIGDPFPQGVPSLGDAAENPAGPTPYGYAGHLYTAAFYGVPLRWARVGPVELAEGEYYGSQLFADLWRTAGVGDSLYALAVANSSSGQSGLKVYDLDPPAEYFYASATVPLPQATHALHADSSHVCVGLSEGVGVLARTDPLDPGPLEVVPLASPVGAVACAGTRVFYARRGTPSDLLGVIDLSSAGAPFVSWEVALEPDVFADHVAVIDDNVIVTLRSRATGPPRLLVVRTAPEGAPCEAQSWAPEREHGSVYGGISVTVHDSVLFAALGQLGIAVFDIQQ